MWTFCPWQQIMMWKKGCGLWALAAGLCIVFGGCGQEAVDGSAVNQADYEVSREATAPADDKVSQESGIPEKQEETEAESGAVVFEDALGRTVSVEKAERVAALLGSFTDVWLTAGGEVVAASGDAWTGLELPLSEDVVNLGSFLEPDIEQLIASRPDLVLASANTDADVELEGILTEAGITVAYFDVSDFQDYLEMLDICTQITGRRELYEQYGTAVAERIAQVKERIDGRKPRVLFLRASTSSVKVKGSTGTVGGELLADMGCINIADSEENLLEDLSLEAILAADPDYIFLTTQGSDTEAVLRTVEETLTSNPAWNSLTAVKEGRYYFLDKQLFNTKPNARWAEAYEQLADILYPEE